MGGAPEEYVYSSSSSRTHSETLIIPRSRAEYDNSSVGEEERFAAHHVRDALLDWQTWMLSMINISVITPGTSPSSRAPPSPFALLAVCR